MYNFNPEEGPKGVFERFFGTNNPYEALECEPTEACRVARGTCVWGVRAHVCACVQACGRERVDGRGQGRARGEGGIGWATTAAGGGGVRLPLFHPEGSPRRQHLLPSQ